jgi:DNA-binding transcriptional regulator YdaS (Cro superfamily)
VTPNQFPISHLAYAEAARCAKACVELIFVAPSSLQQFYTNNHLTPSRASQIAISTQRFYLYGCS